MNLESIGQKRYMERVRYFFIQLLIFPKSYVFLSSAGGSEQSELMLV